MTALLFAVEYPGSPEFTNKTIVNQFAKTHDMGKVQIPVWGFQFWVYAGVVRIDGNAV